MRLRIFMGIAAVLFGSLAFHYASAAEAAELTSRDLDISGSRVAFAPDGHTLAIAPAADEGNITFVNVDTDKKWTTSTARSSHGHGGAAKIAFSPDGKLLASANGSASSGGLSVWRVADGSLCNGFAGAERGLESSALGIALAPDGKTILTGSDAVDLWSLNDDGRLVSGPVFTPMDSGANQPRVSSLAFSPDGLAVAAGDWLDRNHNRANPAQPRLTEQWDGQLILYVSTGKAVAGVPLALPPGNLYEVCFSPDGKSLAALTGIEASGDGGDRAPGGKPLRAGARPANPASSALMLWSVPPRGIPAARSDKATRVATLLADAAERADYLMQEFTPEPDGLGEALAYSAWGVIGVSNDVRREEGALKATNWTTINQYAGRAKRSISFAGDPPANWERKKPEILFETHFSKTISKPAVILQLDILTTCFAFSPDGTTIATGSDDQQIRLWDVRSKRVTKTLEGHSEGVQSLAFSADGTLLASAGGEVKIWQLGGDPQVTVGEDKPEEEKPKPDVPETRNMLRTWTDATGKFKVQAILIAVSDGKVELKREDDSTIAVPIDKLSDADQEFLERTKPQGKKKKKKKKGATG